MFWSMAVLGEASVEGNTEADQKIEVVNAERIHLSAAVIQGYKLCPYKKKQGLCMSSALLMLSNPRV